jgi:hypothetical protein
MKINLCTEYWQEKIVFLSLDIFMKNEKETSESEWMQKRI